MLPALERLEPTLRAHAAATALRPRTGRTSGVPYRDKLFVGRFNLPAQNLIFYRPVCR